MEWNSVEIFTTRLKVHWARRESHKIPVMLITS